MITIAAAQSFYPGRTVTNVWRGMGGNTHIFFDDGTSVLLEDAAQQHAEQAEEHDRNYYVLSDSPDVRYAAEAAIALRQARSNNQPEGTA